MPERFHDQETLLIIIVALVAPPVAVFLMRGCGHEVLICFLLGLLLFFPGQIYAICLVAEHARQLKQKTGKPVVQVTSSTPPPVVQTIEYKPPSAAPPPPTPVSPTPAAPAPTPVPAPPTVAEQVVVVTKSPDKAQEKAPEAPPVTPAPAAAK